MRACARSPFQILEHCANCVLQFVDIGSRGCFVGMLYACCELIRLEVVMEVAWRNGLTDFTMPFMINYMSQQASVIESLKKDNEKRKAKEANERREDENTPMVGRIRTHAHARNSESHTLCANQQFPRAADQIPWFLILGCDGFRGRMAFHAGGSGRYG